MVLGLLLGKTLNAGEAWILWLKAPTPAHTWGETWEIIEAFPTYQECKEAQMQSFVGIRDSWKSSKTVNDLPVKEVAVTEVQFSWMTVWVYFKNGKEEFIGIYEWKCLSDTIDLRK